MTTQPNRFITRYSAFKHKTATKVSTFAILLVVGCSMLSGVANAKPSSDVSKEEMCYMAGDLAYTATTKKDEQKAIAVFDKIINQPNQSPATVAYVTMVKELAYYGLNKQGVFQGDRLKQLIRSKCLSIHSKYFD
jgi:hypothetical protein